MARNYVIRDTSNLNDWKILLNDDSSHFETFLYDGPLGLIQISFKQLALLDFIDVWLKR